MCVRVRESECAHAYQWGQRCSMNLVASEPTTSVDEFRAVAPSLAGQAMVGLVSQ